MSYCNCLSFHTNAPFIIVDFTHFALLADVSLGFCYFTGMPFNIEHMRNVFRKRQAEGGPIWFSSKEERHLEGQAKGLKSLIFESVSRVSSVYYSCLHLLMFELLYVGGCGNF